MTIHGENGRGRRTPPESRELVLAGARKALEDVGIAGLTVRAVMDRTPLGRSSFYVHFDDLDGVLQALLEQNISLFLGPATVWFDAPDADTIRTALDNVIRTWDANRRWWGELIGASMAGRTAVGQAWRRREVDTWVPMVAKRIRDDAPAIRAGASAEAISRAFLLMLFGVLVERSPDEHVDLEGLVDSLVAAGISMFYGVDED